MARLDDASDGLRAIGQHREELLDAYINHRGAILDTEENKSLIRALLKHHLGWRLEEDEPVQISNALTPTLAAVTRNYKMTTADQSISYLWGEIREAIEGYREARHRNAHNDAETYLGTIYDLGHQLIENLREGVAQFSHHISSGFTYIHDLELRARENRRVIQRASQLNDVLETFDHDALQQMAGGDRQLRRLLLRALPKALELCGKELVHAIARLTEMLHTLTRQHRQSRLIDAVANLYQADHGYEPSIDSLEQLPPALNRAEPLLAHSRIDPRNPEHEEDLEDIVQNLPAMEPLEDEEYVPVAVQDSVVQQTETVEPDPVQYAADLFIELALESEQPVSAMKVHRTFPVDCDPELWLLTLVNTVNSLPEKQRRLIELGFNEVHDTVLRGNRWVSDITLKRTKAKTHAA
ncbi:hypothetical protein [Marinobacterium lutimaris]|uniref:Uncharacterized protein n=1 Tax=Marinobacterium lutimaris TaxID=568106 RepID=A0A1H5VRJ2_9GAMM|nr:hypothetical protein [Marinobacterium lutimaris]SEF89955.1 hypothetical protein SAMN05444390_101820 [Marinobacterium lutimaris]